MPFPPKQNRSINYLREHLVGIPILRVCTLANDAEDNKNHLNRNQQTCARTDNDDQRSRPTD
jgi:hypothetical protein